MDRDVPSGLRDLRGRALRAHQLHRADLGGGKLGHQTETEVLTGAQITKETQSDIQDNLLDVLEDCEFTIREVNQIVGAKIRPVIMEFLYGTSFLSQSPEAYERLILDVLHGDPTLFMRRDAVEAAWRFSTSFTA